MNTDRLHAIVLSLHQELETSKIISRMQELINSLNQAINNQPPQLPQALVQNLKVIYLSLADTPSDRFSPAWRLIVEEIGVDEYFGKKLQTNLKNIFEKNAAAPASTLSEIQQILNELKALKTALDQARVAFQFFKIGSEKLEPGECEIGVLIPRNDAKNKLSDLAEEFNELSLILDAFTEVSASNPEELSVKTISSSDILVNLQASPLFTVCMATSVERVIAVYKQLLEIRKLRTELKKQGMTDKQTSEIEDYANNLMEAGIEKAAADVVNEFLKKEDKTRKTELMAAVKTALRRIALKIDKGFNFEVRAEQFADGDEKSKQNLELKGIIKKIQDLTIKIQFIKLEGQPLLSLPDNVAKPKKK